MGLTRKNKKTAVLVILLAIAVGAFATYKYMYKPHKTLDDYEVAFSGTSDDFLDKVKADAEAWNTKVVELTGEITGKDDKGITLNNFIYCQLADASVVTSLNEGTQTTVKGQVMGYDDLLEELKIDKAIISK